MSRSSATALARSTAPADIEQEEAQPRAELVPWQAPLSPAVIWQAGLLAHLTGGDERATAALTEMAAASRASALGHKLYLTVREAAEYTGLPKASLRKMIARNELPAVKLGGWRIKRKYLDEIELRHLRRLTSEAASTG